MQRTSLYQQVRQEFDKECSGALKGSISVGILLISVIAAAVF